MLVCARVVFVFGSLLLQQPSMETARAGFECNLDIFGLGVVNFRKFGNTCSPEAEEIEEMIYPSHWNSGEGEFSAEVAL